MKPEIPLDAMMIRRKKVNGQLLKKKLIAAGLKEDRCEMCGLGPTWNDQPLVLALDHIDGDKTNNVIENIRIACPNCHSQTGTFSGRNIRLRSEQAQRIGSEPV